MEKKPKDQIQEEIKEILKKFKEGEINEDEACEQVIQASQPTNPPPVKP